MMHRCRKMKLRSHVLLLWTSLTCILLATIYFVFTLLIYHHYQEQARKRIEQGVLTLEQRLQQGLQQGLKQGQNLPQDFLAERTLAERITSELLGRIAQESGCDIYLYAASVGLAGSADPVYFSDSQMLASSLATGAPPLSVKDYPVDNLPVLGLGTGGEESKIQWKAQQISDENNIMYGARLLVQEQEGEEEYAVLLFVQPLEFVHQGVTVLGRALVIVFVMVFLLFLPVAAFFVRSSVTRPVERLISAMNSFDTRQNPLLDEEVGTVEFSSLASSFNRMVRVLRHHDQQVSILSTAIEQSPTAVVITDLEGKIEYVNSRMEQLTGYTAEELKGRSTRIFQSGYTPAGKYGELWQTVMSGKVWKEELLNKRKDGILSWESVIIAPIFSEDSTIVKFVATKEDITERKKTGELLRQSEKRYRQTFETNMAVKLIIDPTEGAIVEANQAAAFYYGYSVDQLVAMRITDINQLSPEEVREEMARAEQEERLYFNFRHRLASGEVRDVEVYSGPLQSGERKLLYSIIHDITDRKQAEKAQKQAEQQLVAAKEQAESANRAKSIFLANITHELRTPLNAVLGYAQLLGADSTLTSKQLNRVQIIKNSGEYLLMLINDILDLSKIEAEKIELVPRVFRLPDFFSGIVDVFRAEADFKGVTLRCLEDPQQSAFVQADELRIRQVIFNLLSNAVKFTPKGGDCLLQSEVKKQGEKKAFVTITVEDNGPGIPLEMQEDIFEPFRQSGERLQYSEGTGLGLAISHKLVRLMGGELRVKSPLDLHYQQGEKFERPGSRFFFTIPVEIIDRSRAAQEMQHVVTGYTVIQGETPKKVLIVSESASHQAVLESILSPLGFQVSELASKDVLSDMLADMSVDMPGQFRPDAILAVLPTAECEELAVLQQIKEQEKMKFLPVIVLADEAVFSALEEKQQEDFCTAHVVKPFSGFDLLSVLAEHLPIALVYDKDNNKGDNNGEVAVGEQGFVAPPDEELEALLFKVRQGDVAGINRQVSSLLSMDSGKYKKFAEQVERLVGDFQLNMIADLVKRYGIF
ncbi:MAG: PAS domain S-box protein [Candidatus Electrothrix sp.]